MMMRSLRCALFILALLLAARPAHAVFEFVGNVVGVTREGAVLHLQLQDNHKLDVTVCNADVVRFHYARNNFDTVPSFAVPSPQRTTDFTVDDRADVCTLHTADLEVRIRKSPCRVSIFDRSGHPLNEDDASFGVAFDGNVSRCFKRLQPHERFYGLGEKAGGIERTGRQYDMWNWDFMGYGPEFDPLYMSIPFYLGFVDGRAYGIFLDNTHRTTFCMGAGNDRFAWFGAAGGDLDYYFIGGPDPRQVVERYTALTGRMPLPPRWALGFQQSRYSYESADVVRDVARNFRDRHIPCDAIYLDIDYMNGYRVFTWNHDRFPDPAGLIAELSAQGFHVIPIIDPGVKVDPTYSVAQEGLQQHLFATYPDGTPYKGEVWPSWAYFPDFTTSAAREWWGGHLEQFLDLGVSGFWNDMNEPAVWGRNVPDIVQFQAGDLARVHNVFALEEARTTFDAERRHGIDRPFILTRAGFSGTQRYAAVWTGDNLSNETHLRMAATMPQSVGLSGVPFVGTDVGGYEGSPTAQLYIRWMQLGAVTPFFRAHSAKFNPRKEPWALGEFVEACARQAIELRYRLMPYLYSAFHETSVSGLPVMRPLLLEFPGDSHCFEEAAQSEFMVGDALLAAPVLSEHDTARRLYLPHGRWIALDSGESESGGRWLTVDAPIERLPLFLREGHVVAMRDAIAHEGEKTSPDLHLHISLLNGNGPPVSSTIYDDDGKTLRYQAGAYRTTRVDVGATDVHIVTEHAGYDGGVKTWVLHLYAPFAPKTVRVNGTATAFTLQGHAAIVRVPATNGTVHLEVLGSRRSAFSGQQSAVSQED